jgi:hypothetical protein
MEAELVKKTLLGLLLAVTLSVVSSAPALAQNYHRPPQTAKTTPSPDVVPMAPDAGNVKIFSNLGTNTDAFDSTNGYFVSGQGNGFNAQKQDIAIPFTPRADATATGIKIALQYYGYGVNGATVAIFSDAGGLPGTPLVKKDVKDFLDFGAGCCTLVNVKLGQTGLAVKKGVQYWVVGTTDRATNDSVNTWDFVWNDAAGTFAFQQDNGGWLLLTAADGYPPSAVAVVGTQP